MRRGQGFTTTRVHVGSSKGVVINRLGRRRRSPSDVGEGRGQNTSWQPGLQRITNAQLPAERRLQQDIRRAELEGMYSKHHILFSTSYPLPYQLFLKARAEPPFVLPWILAILLGLMKKWSSIMRDGKTFLWTSAYLVLKGRSILAMRAGNTTISSQRRVTLSQSKYPASRNTYLLYFKEP